MKVLIIVFLLSLVCYTASYKILVVYALPITSINFLGQSIVKQLLKDGHEVCDVLWMLGTEFYAGEAMGISLLEIDIKTLQRLGPVTYISTHPMNLPQSKSFRQIDVSQNRALLENSNDTTWSIATILDNNFENERQGIQDFCRVITQMTFANENVTKFLENSDEHFDAVIADWMESEIYVGLSVLYDCPMMWIFSMGTNWQVMRLIGDTPSPAYDTDYYGDSIPPFTFAQRVKELYARIRWSLYKRFYITPIERDIYETTFGPLLAKKGRVLPDYEEVIYNASMVFVNEHNAAFGRPSTPQNLKFIGGIHVEDPVKPLPEDLQDLMDNSQHGVIYFSLGSFLKAKELPIKFVRDILKVLGELNETVIWKYEENLKDIPNNVRIVQWAPQQSILAHSNCKFFISHGGHLSTIETIHFGKPIIGVPGLLDQITNINRATAIGFAIKVKLDYDLPENLRSAIKLMLNDDTYQKRTKELSIIYHDRPMKPGDELTYWVRHVIETRGAMHLRSPAIDVPLYQRVYIDLLAVILVIAVILCLSLRTLLRKKNLTKKILEKKKK